MDKRYAVAEIDIHSESATVAGRIMSVRKMKNYCFCDLWDMSGKIQLILPAGRELPIPSVGDIVLTSGDIVTTKAGRLSIQSTVIEVLSKSNNEVFNAIRSVSTPGFDMHGHRALNLMVNEDLKKMVIARSLFIGIIRDHFKENDFLEIDTPVVSYSRFAGTADVFETKSRTLDKSLYLRGTLEDYLKQLVVAGFEKVFQIGDCFRNESPALIEFSMLEATWAYAKSEQMLDLIQKLILELCTKLPDELVNTEARDELSKKIDIVTFWGVLEEYFKVDIRTQSVDTIRELTKKENYVYTSEKNDEYEIAKFGYEVIKRSLAKKFEVPTFVGRFPAVISPLAKVIPDGSGEADRGYGFFRGQRLFEVVEEANDYEEQLNKFQSQDDRSHDTSHSFKHDDLLSALSYGCPPMAGLGFNINRVLAVLLNVNRTSDVMAFPLTSSALPL